MQRPKWTWVFVLCVNELTGGRDTVKIGRRVPLIFQNVISRTCLCMAFVYLEIQFFIRLKFNSLKSRRIKIDASQGEKKKKKRREIKHQRNASVRPRFLLIAEQYTNTHVACSLRHAGGCLIRRVNEFSTRRQKQTQNVLWKNVCVCVCV